MEINVTYARPDEDGPRTGPVKVGWLLNEEKGGILFDPPERVRSADMNKQHAKSASRCPAVINLESRYFSIACPYDMRLGFIRGAKGEAGLRNMLGDSSPVRANKLGNVIHMVPEHEWRYPARPTIQMTLPYVFITDEPVYVNQVAPFMHYRPDPMPGTIFGGRFPINLWPRPLMWAFEWHDISKELVLTRGEPLFYCMFETAPQDRPVVMVEAERTPELNSYLELISGAVNYVNQTFSLFKAAEERRPPTLLTPKRRT